MNSFQQWFPVRYTSGLGSFASSTIVSLLATFACNFFESDFWIEVGAPLNFCTCSRTTGAALEPRTGF